MFNIIRIYCAECGTDLTDRARYGDVYSCQECDAWTMNIITRDVSALTTADMV